MEAERATTEHAAATLIVDRERANGRVSRQANNNWRSTTCREAAQYPFGRCTQFLESCIGMPSRTAWTSPTAERNQAGDLRPGYGEGEGEDEGGGEDEDGIRVRRSGQ